MDPVHSTGGYDPDPSTGSAGFAITSMVLGIVAIVFSCCIPFLTLLCSIIGLPFGIISLVTGRKGKGMAIAGLITCSVGLILAVVVIIFAVAVTDWDDLWYYYY